MSAELTIGFLPLVDACLPILAREHGFAEDEGLSLRLVRDTSWATVLDRLLYGHSDAAHMVAPLAIATTLGRGRPAQPLAAPFVLGLNGNAVTVRPELAARIGTGGALGDPAAVGAALKAIAAERAAEGRPLRFGVVHRHSSHNYMLRYWLAACGLRPDCDVEFVTVAPPFCADALEAGEVDAICVGEPWNSVAVERGAGEIVLATAQIWRRGVEKVLALREPVLEARRGEVEALIRALVRTGRHFVDPENWGANAAILARPSYLDGSSAHILGAISDRLLLAQGGRAGRTIPTSCSSTARRRTFPGSARRSGSTPRWCAGTASPSTPPTRRARRGCSAPTSTAARWSEPANRCPARARKSRAASPGPLWSAPSRGA